MDRKILTYDSVEISFGGKAVVHDVSFSLEHGEILGLVGESGSGKSTLIKAAMGLLGPDGLVTRGDIRYMNQNILDIPEKEKRKIRGAGIGMIFQDAGASLCPIRTIGEQIYESMRVHTKITRSEAKTRAMDLFDKLNFKDSQRVWDSYPFELSGGMNQRAGIAIAMLMNPPILQFSPVLLYIPVPSGLCDFFHILFIQNPDFFHLGGDLHRRGYGRVLGQKALCRGLLIGADGQVQHLVLGVLDHIHGDALLISFLLSCVSPAASGSGAGPGPAAYRPGEYIPDPALSESYCPSL